MRFRHPPPLSRTCVLATGISVVLAAVLLTGCSDAEDSVPPDLTATSVEPGRLPVPVYHPEVLEELPHDPGAFTQGLVLDGDRFFESTGIRGSSSLREVALDSGEVVRSQPVPAEYFGEGLALVDDRLIQITWQEGEAFVYDAETFEQVASFNYEGEGWGLCFDGERLVMSDGSPTLTFRDPETFEETGSVDVTLDGQGVDELNELECVDDRVYANVWNTDRIVEIDAASGEVMGVIDAAGLLEPERAVGADVLNGIAHVPGDDTFWLTGKLWPAMFRVRLVEATD